MINQKTLSHMKYNCNRLIAIFLAKIPQNKTVTRIHNKQHYIVKYRSPLQKIALYFAHYKKWDNNIVFLSGKEWYSWEKNVLETLYPQQQVIVNKQLWIPLFEGKTLAQILRFNDYEIQKKSFGFAVEELYRCHQIIIADPICSHWLFSHGDATANNIICNNKRAFCIDFDIKHEPNTSSCERQADDLRALIYSSCALLPSQNWRELLCIVEKKYPSKEILNMLRESISNDNLSIYKIAQSCLSWQQNKELQTMINFVFCTPEPCK